MKWIPLLSFGLIGICLLIVGIIYAIKTCLLYRSGRHAKGKVVEMVQSGYYIHLDPLLLKNVEAPHPSK